MDKEIDKKKISREVMDEINAVTPIFAVSLVTRAGKARHFANFYGTTIYKTKGMNQVKAETAVQKNDAKIFSMLEELEQIIQNGGFKKVQKDLLVEVNWAQFGGWMHKHMAEMEDAIACSTVERAFALFEKEYANIGKTEKQILDEQSKAFRESLAAWDDEFDS